MTDTTQPRGTTAGHQPRIDFWFDPACPWAWMTSRWMAEVAEVRGLTVHWRILSLGVLNEGKAIDPGYREHLEHTWTAARAVVAAGELLGEDVVGALYTEIGTRFHPGGRTNQRGAVVEAFTALGLDTAIIERAEAGEFDEAMRASTQAALDLVGDDVGVPVLALDGKAYFGPVVTPAPTGQAALDLFDALVLATRVDGFYELKRTRDESPRFD